METYTTTEIGEMDAWDLLDSAAPGKAFVEDDLGLQFIGMSVNSTPPGATSPFWHRHSKIEEMYVFLKGDGEMAIDDEVIRVKAGTIVRIPPQTWMAVHCPKSASTPLKWLCIRGGGDSLEAIGNDAEMDRERPFPW